MHLQQVPTWKAALKIRPTTCAGLQTSGHACMAMRGPLFSTRTALNTLSEKRFVIIRRWSCMRARTPCQTAPKKVLLILPGLRSHSSQYTERRQKQLSLGTAIQLSLGTKTRAAWLDIRSKQSEIEHSNRTVKLTRRSTQKITNSQMEQNRAKECTW